MFERPFLWDSLCPLNILYSAYCKAIMLSNFQFAPDWQVFAQHRSPGRKMLKMNHISHLKLALTDWLLVKDFWAAPAGFGCHTNLAPMGFHDTPIVEARLTSVTWRCTKGTRGSVPPMWLHINQQVRLHVSRAILGFDPCIGQSLAAPANVRRLSSRRPRLVKIQMFHSWEVGGLTWFA